MSAQPSPDVHALTRVDGGSTPTPAFAAGVRPEASVPVSLRADARSESPSSLREALFAAPTRTASAAVRPSPTAVDPADTLLLPTAPELLAASPNLQRLCEGYHNTRRRAIERGRRQRLGIAAMVCVLGVAAVVLFQQGSVPDVTVKLLVVTVALASTAGLGALAALWLREDRRLRQAQGDRLLRALQFNCALPEANLQAFRRVVPAQQAFFEVYNVWRLEHPDRRSPLSALLSSARRAGGRASA
jgi:hypothetical protein